MPTIRRMHLTTSSAQGTERRAALSALTPSDGKSRQEALKKKPESGQSGKIHLPHILFSQLDVKRGRAMGYVE